MKDTKQPSIARLGQSKLGECVLLSSGAAPRVLTIEDAPERVLTGQGERQTYEQVHGFTFLGEARFLAFLGELAATDVNVEVCRASCLGVIEDNLNADIAQPLDWELSPLLSRDGKAHQYRAELDDFIIESVLPDDE